MYTAEIIITAFLWGACAVVGYIIGGYKGRQGAGAIFGALLGPIGWIITALLPMSAEAEAKRMEEIERVRENRKRMRRL